DLANGTLSSAQHENARAELERRVLDESQQGSVDGAQQTAGRAWLTPLVVGVLLPIVSVGLYMHLGSSDGIDVEAYSRQEAANITPDDVARMVG
ncbi:MAG: c-type cytochrome biogenesis protein CcmI, partial [Burkholderiales bacterium]|nr:c-type cytochrome biogenesis protein CcmI [Burkholderiales bacterium]